jgi:hypothetical protein
MKKVRTLAQALADPRVASYSDERDRGFYNDGIWLYLKSPWFCPDTDLPVVHEWNVRDLCRSLNSCYEDENRAEIYEIF